MYKAKEIQTGEVVALKKIRMENEKEGVCTQETSELYLLSILIYLETSLRNVQYFNA